MPQHDAKCLHAKLTPARADVEEVARRTAARIAKILPATGRTFELQEDGGPPPGLAACYAAAARGISVSGDRAGLPTLRLVFPHDPPPRGAETGPLADEPVAEVRGINVHARQLVDGRDRRQLERLCRYITRLPLLRSGSPTAGSSSGSSTRRRTARVLSRGRPTGGTA